MVRGTVADGMRAFGGRAARSGGLRRLGKVVGRSGGEGRDVEVMVVKSPTPTGRGIDEPQEPPRMPAGGDAPAAQHIDPNKAASQRGLLTHADALHAQPRVQRDSAIVRQGTGEIGHPNSRCRP